MATMAQHVRTTIRYDGSALVSHEMDVQELAPALLALAEMIQLANHRFNGDSSTMRVLVKADVEQRCFQLDIHIIQSILESARHLFSVEQYKTAKEIAEFLDLILPGGFAGGVFWVWKKLWGKAPDETKSISEFEVEHRGGVTIINNVYGDGNTLEMPTEVYEFATDPEVIALGKKVVSPLERPGYETLGFYSDQKPVIELNETEARSFIASAPIDAVPIEPVAVDDAVLTCIPGRAGVRTQRNEGKAQWELKWAGKAIWANIADEEWLESFQAGKIPVPVGSWLDILMEMTTSRSNPDAAPTYKVTKVNGVIPPPEIKQISLFEDMGE